MRHSPQSMNLATERITYSTEHTTHPRYNKTLCEYFGAPCIARTLFEDCYLRSVTNSPFTLLLRPSENITMSDGFNSAMTNRSLRNIKTVNQPRMASHFTSNLSSRSLNSSSTPMSSRSSNTTLSSTNSPPMPPQLAPSPPCPPNSCRTSL